MVMMLKIISILLVTIGTGLLIYSLLPINQIWREPHQHPQQRLGWNVLLGLILLFILGYVAFSYIVFSSEVTGTETMVALILFGGGWFVVLVTRMSLLSIQSAKHVAALERHNALHDELTSLPNRTLLYERMKQAIRSARRNNTTMIVMIMDLDQFKEVNDTLGHHCGDRLLQQVAPRLKGVVRETDTVARLGGDEFAVILPHTDAAGAVVISKKMNEVLEKPFTVEGHNLKIGISIGIAKYPQDGTDGDTLLQKADVAMYVAKKDISGYATYDVSRDQHSINRLQLIGKLYEAINNNELELYYQPIIKIKGHGLLGFEALVRWNHPDLGLVEPGEFIPIAEQSGLINDLTFWVLNTGLKQLQDWLKQEKDLCLSVNLSVKDIQDADFVNQLRKLLYLYNITPGKLNIEITESSMMSDSRRAHDVIDQLHELGVKLAIDDFGTGFSSLSYLKHLPAHTIKIDRTFVMDMLEDDNDAIIVRSTIDLAHNMGRTVIAEGVESKDVLDILEILGCDYAQGYYLCRPEPAFRITGKYLS